MNLARDENILDVGSGAGWLVRMIAERVPEGRVIGMDISDEMVRRARRKYVAVENAMFVVGAADEIPWTQTSSHMRFPSSQPITGPTRRAACAKSIACCARAAPRGF